MYKILIADNQTAWLNFSKDALEGQGYKVVTALTVDSLRSMLEQNNHDLILINAEFMFGEFEGMIQKLFKQNADKKPFIVVSVPSSTHKSLQETRTAFKLGARDYVEKPFSTQQLLSLVKHLLDEFVGEQKQHQGAAP